MCMTDTRGIDHVIPVMLDTKGDVIFGPLHGPWEKEHIQQARQHISYILINSKNYASGKDQARAAWATRFSARNLREYGDSFQHDHATEPDPSDGSESGNDETLQENLDADSQYVWQDDDEPNVAIGMKDAEMRELETDNVFLSLIQDFGQKCRNEPWVAVGAVLKTYTRPRPPLEQPPLETQFIVILKGIGAATYECLKNNLQEPDNSASNQLQNRTRSYLKELTSARVDYVDKKGTRKRAAGMQNIPLVYGDSMLGSESWARHRPALRDGWRAEQEAYGGAVEHVSMDEVEMTSLQDQERRLGKSDQLSDQINLY